MLVTSDFRLEVEMSQVRACALKKYAIYGRIAEMFCLIHTTTAKLNTRAS